MGRGDIQSVSDGDLDVLELRLMSTHFATDLYKQRVSKKQKITATNYVESTRESSSVYFRYQTAASDV